MFSLFNNIRIRIRIVVAKIRGCDDDFLLCFSENEKIDSVREQPDPYLGGATQMAVIPISLIVLQIRASMFKFLRIDLLKIAPLHLYKIEVRLHCLVVAVGKFAVKKNTPEFLIKIA